VSCLLVLAVYGASFFLPAAHPAGGEAPVPGWSVFLGCLSTGGLALLGLLPHLLLWLGVFLLGLGKWRGAAAAGAAALALGTYWLWPASWGEALEGGAFLGVLALLGSMALLTVGAVQLHRCAAGRGNAALARLKDLSRLEELDLRGACINDAGLRHLEGATSLLRLDLSFLPITDEGLRSLKGLSRLHTLRLDSTRIGDAGLEHLGGLTGLRELDLSFTSVSDAGLAHLSKLTGLRKLQVHVTRVTVRGINELQKALPGLHISH
jgi:Leucine-rich repeat (LRR) protein